MADIYDEFVTYLKTQSGVTDLVGTGTAARIYPDVPRQGATLPFLVLAETVGGQSWETIGGDPSGMAEAVFQVWAFDNDRGDANDLAEAVRLAGPLQGYRGAMGSTKVRVTSPEGRFAGADLPKDSSDRKRYYCRRNFHLFYDEATS